MLRESAETWRVPELYLSSSLENPMKLVATNTQNFQDGRTRLKYDSNLTEVLRSVYMAMLKPLKRPNTVLMLNATAFFETYSNLFFSRLFRKLETPHKYARIAYIRDIFSPFFMPSSLYCDICLNQHLSGKFYKNLPPLKYIFHTSLSRDIWLRSYEDIRQFMSSLYLQFGAVKFFKMSIKHLGYSRL